MEYRSTRDSSRRVSAAEAIVSGLAPDGGLFLPASCPTLTLAEITELAKQAYPQRAADILGRFLTDYSQQELLCYAEKAYEASRFSAEGTAPVVKLADNAYVLELFHGPTCAFKDFALQILPYLLTAAIKKTGVDKTVIILVATSGDTGKAALEGFADVAGTKICVFYPAGGTSNIQRRQMTTQDGSNVMIAAVQGNFDDAQNGVKAIFTDAAYASVLAKKGALLSSANSINWGRLAPQIAYYVSAYCDLLNQGAIQLGDAINICVPTGNFGNILAAYYAKQMGLPVNKLICASNRNSVLTDFISSGTYDRNRPFYLTSSPSMDILISSNLERLLSLLYEGDDTTLCHLMDSLKQAGKYTIAQGMLARLQQDFASGCCDEEATFATIRRVFEENHYLLDTHSAVAVKVYCDYCAQTGDSTPTVIAATASPFKFCGSVLPALGYEKPEDDFAMLDQLSTISGLAVPERLSALRSKEERFTEVVAKEQMQSVVDTLV